MQIFLGSTFEATGNWGSLFCDLATGLVVRYERGGEWNKPGDGYDDITRLDVDEWRSYYPGEDPAGPHDILDFGSWDEGGRYVPAEADWREEFRKSRRAA